MSLRWARVRAPHPARLDIEVYRGDSFFLLVQLSAHGLPFPSFGCMFRSFIRETIDGAKIDEFDVERVDDSRGLIRLSLPLERAALFPESAVWDLQMQHKDARHIQTILRGMVYATPDVTSVEPLDQSTWDDAQVYIPTTSWDEVDATWDGADAWESRVLPPADGGTP